MNLPKTFGGQDKSTVECSGLCCCHRTGQDLCSFTRFIGQALRHDTHFFIEYLPSVDPQWRGPLSVITHNQEKTVPSTDSEHTRPLCHWWLWWGSYFSCLCSHMQVSSNAMFVFPRVCSEISSSVCCKVWLLIWRVSRGFWLVWRWRFMERYLYGQACRDVVQEQSWNQAEVLVRKDTCHNWAIYLGSSKEALGISETAAALLLWASRNLFPILLATITSSTVEWWGINHWWLANKVIPVVALWWSRLCFIHGANRLGANSLLVYLWSCATVADTLQPGLPQSLLIRKLG